VSIQSTSSAEIQTQPRSSRSVPLMGPRMKPPLQAVTIKIKVLLKSNLPGLPQRPPKPSKGKLPRKVGTKDDQASVRREIIRRPRVGKLRINTEVKLAGRNIH